MSVKILVTGATGNVGGEVIRLLAGEDCEIVAGLRDVAGWRNDAARGVKLDFKDAATFPAALAGVEKIFLMLPPGLGDIENTINPFVTRAAASGVRHIAFLSLLGAEKLPFLPHRRIEKHLVDSGVAFAFLRASFFMQNFSTTHRAEIRERREIFVPAGRGRTSFVDARDVAAVAARSLLSDECRNRVNDLTGAESLNYFEVAALFAEVLGEKITYRNPSLARFLFAKLRGGTPLGFALVMSGIYTTARLGLAGRVTDETEKILGRPPISLRRFIEDYRAAWAG